MPGLVCVTANLALSCSVGAKQNAVEAALGADETRRESFEAVLRVLDSNPKYVDQFWSQAQNHPKTLDRFFENAANDLDREKLAQLNAVHLVNHPGAVEQVMIAVLDAAAEHPKALAAIGRAIAARPELSAKAMEQHPAAIESSVVSLIQEIRDNSAARAKFLVGLQRSSPGMADLLISNPKTLDALMQALLESGSDSATKALEKLLRPQKD